MDLWETHKIISGEISEDIFDRIAKEILGGVLGIFFERIAREIIKRLNKFP